jgi:putative glutamine amidotransferase
MKISRKAPLLLSLLLLSLVFITVSCRQETEKGPVYIGISKGAPEQYYGNYARWLKNADSTVICLDLYHMPLDSALTRLDGCSGLLISGGPDVYPGRYDAADDTVNCGPIDYFRDTLEFALIQKAIASGMPIMGICRGHQIFNIYHNGSLYADIPADLDTLVTHRCKDTYDCNHQIRVINESRLYQLSGLIAGMVGTGMKAVARTDEGLIESIEYTDRENMPFFMGVQWHPERMDPESPFSFPIAKEFLQAAGRFQK